MGRRRPCHRNCKGTAREDRSSVQENTAAFQIMRDSRSLAVGVRLRMGLSSDHEERSYRTVQRQETAGEGFPGEWGRAFRVVHAPTYMSDPMGTSHGSVHAG